MLLISALLSNKSAEAGVADWELNEIFQDGNESTRRFIELRNLEGGCLFPSSTIDLYDLNGQLLGIFPLVQSTSCYGAPTYLLLATPEISAQFAVARDGAMNRELPSDGQLCFSSSETNYDCVRWGTVNTPLFDLFGAGDITFTSLSGIDLAQSRISTSHVVSIDWQERALSPRQPNDGSVWIPPDAGPLPDAGPIVDAGVPRDAAMRVDSGSGPSPDAQTGVDRNDRYLDLDPGGGAGCSCNNANSPRTGGALFCALFALLGLRRIRRAS